MIVIPGEMPNNCFECPCAHIGKKPHKQWCNITKNNISNYRCTRLAFACPINIEASNRANKNKYAQGITSIQVLDEKNMLRNNSKENDLEIAKRCNECKHEERIEDDFVIFQQTHSRAKLPERCEVLKAYKVFACEILHMKDDMYSIYCGVGVSIPKNCSCVVCPADGVKFVESPIRLDPGYHVLHDIRIIATEDTKVEPSQHFAWLKVYVQR